MFAKTWKTVLACVALSGCASLSTTRPGEDVHGTPVGVEAAARSVAQHTTDSDTADDRADRFRFVDDRERRLSSVMLLPTPVEGLVAVGPMARSRIFLGALFATQVVGGDRVAAVGLVIRSVGGGLGPAVSASPWIVVTVDGERVMRGSLSEIALYAADRGPWGPEETLTFRIPPEVMKRLATGSDVEVQLGEMVIFRLADANRDDIGAFLQQIPEGTRFQARPALADWLRTQAQ